MRSVIRPAVRWTLTAFVLLASPAIAQKQAEPGREFKVIAFDAFPIFDPRPIAALAEELYPGRGRELMAVWRARQFEYQWLRALSGQYADFMQATEEGLRFAARSLEIDLSEDRRDRLISEYMNLSVWPDAAASVRALRKSGYRLVFLSNMTAEMLERGLGRAGLVDEFEAIFSTDAARTYKPAPEAYRMAVDGLSVAREDVLFVAFAGWDAAGAEWFGYPTFWMNRLGSPMEELGVRPDAEGSNMQALMDFLAIGVGLGTDR